MDLVRVLQTSAVTLSHTFLVDEVAADATGTVNVAVARLDGTAVTAGAATHGATGVYTYPMVSTATLDTLTVDWSGTVGGALVTVRDIVEVVGGFLFSVSEARTAPPVLSVTKYPTALIAAKRVGVEQECERICNQAFVPRFERVQLDGNGMNRLMLPRNNLRALRAVKVNGAVWSTADVATVGVQLAGVLVLSPRTTWGGAYWPIGVGNVVLEYEYGLDMPPMEIRDAAIVRLRYRLGMTDTSVPYRALSFTAQDGGIYRLSTPGKQRTGIPDVDAAYEGWTQDLGGFA